MPAKVVSTPALPGLSPVGGKPVIARFDGGHLSSDGGLLVLRAAGISHQKFCRHSLLARRDVMLDPS